MTRDGPAFVAGATGLTGGAVVRHLRDAGVAVTAHVRPDSGRLDAHRARFEGLGAEVDTTAWDEAAMTETLERLSPTVVFALLGTTRKRKNEVAKHGGDASQETYEAVDYGLTALLRRACEASGHEPRFVYLSSMGVTEGTSNRYLAVRYRLESELAAGTIPYVIARPSIIHGDREESRAGEAVGGALLDAGLAVLGAFGARTTRDRYRSITGDQLGRALVKLAFDPAAEGRTALGEELYRLGTSPDG